MCSVLNFNLQARRPQKYKSRGEGVRVESQEFSKNLILTYYWNKKYIYHKKHYFEYLYISICN